MAKNYLESIISDAQQVREASFENAKKAILDATGPILRKAYMEGLELEADDETNETETPKKKKAPKDDEEEYEPKEKKSSNEDEDDEESKESKSDDGED